jgi:hypothetical protein
MRFLILSDRDIDKNTELNQFFALAEPDEIEIIQGENAAKEWINKHLFTRDKHLDLIMILRSDRSPYDYFIDEENIRTDSFIDWIRESKEEYSDSNFNFKSIPVVLFDSDLHERSVMSSSFRNKKYNLIFPYRSFWRYDEYFIPKLSRPIYNWIRRIGDELDNIDLDLSFNFSISRVSKIDTLGYDVLSESFLRKQQSLNYLWTNGNIELIEKTADLWEKLVKESVINPRKRNEKDIHKLILTNDLVLRGENFKKTIYEHQFYYKNSRSYAEPDFINLPHNYSFSRPEVFEVKLINRCIFSKKTGRVGSYGRKSIAQVSSKYRNYFSDWKTNGAQITKATLPPEDYQYTLLIGQDSEDGSTEDRIRGLEVENHISLLSFNELMSRYSRLHDRIKRFRLV